MQRKLMVCTALLLISLGNAQASTKVDPSTKADQGVSAVLAKTLPGASVIGEARLSVAFWDVYDATLYAPGGTWDAAKPFALSLRYLRNLDGKDIADRSVQEMRGQGFNDEVKLAAWNAQMKSIFPDVQNGSILTAVFTQGQTVFYDEKQSIGTIKGADFASRFSGIWLSEKTSEPVLRKRLLGLK